MSPVRDWGERTCLLCGPACVSVAWGRVVVVVEGGGCVCVGLGVGVGGGGGGGRVVVWRKRVGLEVRSGCPCLEAAQV